MATTDLLKKARFVIDSDGRATAVQIDIATWSSLLDWLEDNEDRAIFRAAIPDLRKGPAKGKALRWEDVKNEWDDATGEA